MSALPISNENRSWIGFTRPFAANAIGAAAMIEASRRASEAIKTGLSATQVAADIRQSLASHLSETSADSIVSEIIACIALTTANATVGRFVSKAAEELLGADEEAMSAAQFISMLLPKSKATLIGSIAAGIFAFFNDLFASRSPIFPVVVVHVQTGATVK